MAAERERLIKGDAIDYLTKEFDNIELEDPSQLEEFFEDLRNSPRELSFDAVAKLFGRCYFFIQLEHFFWRTNRTKENCKIKFYPMEEKLQGFVSRWVTQDLRIFVAKGYNRDIIVKVSPEGRHFFPPPSPFDLPESNSSKKSSGKEQSKRKKKEFPKD